MSGSQPKRDRKPAEADAIKVGAMPDLPNDVCGRAATAELSKGTELTVLEMKAPMSKVKVETGRSTGFVGWVLDVDIAEPRKP